MTNQQWEKISLKLDAMSMRERALVFATAVILILSLLNTLILDPLFLRQKKLQGQLALQQQQMSEVQTQIAVLVQENSPNSNSPQQTQLGRLRQEIAEGNAYQKSTREKLVHPEKMAEHLRLLLNRNSRLQLVALQTLAATPLINPSGAQGAEQAKVAPLVSASQEKMVYKHGVQLTLRGNYLDLLQYLSALEKLPQQMYWAKAQLKVVEHPSSELTLILYTLSLDKTWLQI